MKKLKVLIPLCASFLIPVYSEHIYKSFAWAGFMQPLATMIVVVGAIMACIFMTVDL